MIQCLLKLVPIAPREFIGHPIEVRPIRQIFTLPALALPLQENCESVVDLRSEAGIVQVTEVVAHQQCFGFKGQPFLFIVLSILSINLRTSLLHLLLTLLTICSRNLPMAFLGVVIDLVLWQVVGGALCDHGGVAGLL